MYEDLIQRERDALERSRHDAEAIMARAQSETRDVTPEEERQVSTILLAADTIKGRIAKFEKLEADAKRANELRRGLPQPEGDPDRRRGGDQIRELIAAGEREVEFDLAGALTEKRAIAEFSDSNSLYQPDFAGRVAMYLKTMSPWMNLATIVSADNGRPLVVPTLTADGTIYSPGEGTAITESSATLGTVTITPVSYKSLQYVSAEAWEDAEYDITAALARSAARAINYVSGTAFSATILAGISNGGTATGTPFFNFDDLIGLSYGRAAEYRANASWVMANGAISKTRKFTASTSGEYIWAPVGADGQPNALLGAAVFEDPGLATPASATKSVIYGDIAAAVVIKATRLRVAISQDARFANDQIALKVVGRMAAGVQDAAAASYLVSATS